MTKQREYKTKYDSVLQSALAELKERKIYREADIHLVQEYASELAFAYVLGTKIQELPDSKEDTFIRYTRTRKANLVNANQLARTLRLAPMGRQMSGTEPEKEEEKTGKFNIMSLAKQNYKKAR